MCPFVNTYNIKLVTVKQRYVEIQNIHELSTPLVVTYTHIIEKQITITLRG